MVSPSSTAQIPGWRSLCGLPGDFHSRCERLPAKNLREVKKLVGLELSGGGWIPPVNLGHNALKVPLSGLHLLDFMRNTHRQTSSGSTPSVAFLLVSMA